MRINGQRPSTQSLQISPHLILSSFSLNKHNLLLIMAHLSHHRPGTQVNNGDENIPPANNNAPAGTLRGRDATTAVSCQ